MMESPVFKDLVLIGGGHSHALVLRQWAMNPLPGVRITLISPQTMTPYSGMLPGLIAGHYSFEQTHIDLVKLSLWANIRFIQDEVTHIDTDSNSLSLKQRPDLEFDVLSIDIGSTPNQSIEGFSEYSIPVKPISGFYDRWMLIQDRARQKQINSLSVIGGGAGSIEIMLSIACKLKNLNSDLQYNLLTAADDILPGYNSTVKQRVNRQLKYYGVEVRTSARVARLSQGLIHTESGQTIASDETISCTQASGSHWLAQTELDCDEQGFVKVRPTLQVLDSDHIFAAGDIAHMVESPRPKAGVYAVRQAKTLFHNLRAILLKQSPVHYKPQDGFLSLLALGEKTATGSKSWLSFSGDWVWNWKDSIDRKFMDKFHGLPELSMDASSKIHQSLIDDADKNEQHDPDKRCAGCGGKIGASVLQQVINKVLGEDIYQPEDAVQLSAQPEVIYQSVDAIKTPIQDVYLFGQIAVNHALSDLYAMNVTPESVQVLITLPYASQAIQRRQLKTLMQGIISQLNKLECRLIGGHTSEASELSVGLTVNGIKNTSNLFTKDGLQFGDKLVISKALGTGIMLAGAMLNECDGVDFNKTIQSMLTANNTASDMLKCLEVMACTDVTGFGLLGHLNEMCLASNCAVKLDLDSIPLLPGVQNLSSRKIKSSLYSQNSKIIESLNLDKSLSEDPRFDVLFDPQTSGGLLAGISAQQYEKLTDEFHQQFYTIGEVLSPGDMLTRIQIESNGST